MWDTSIYKCGRKRKRATWWKPFIAGTDAGIEPRIYCDFDDGHVLK